METFNLLLLFVAIIWTILMVYEGFRSYKLHKHYNWFKHKSFLFAFITIESCYFTLGIVIWSNPFNLLNFNSVIFLLFLGVAFFLLWIGFKALASRDLKNSFLKERKAHNL